MASAIALLLHMHQPEYRNPVDGRRWMPWTRMHALRGYRDVALECIEQDLPVTLNWVPGLLDQLLDVASLTPDRHLELTEKPADALSPVEQWEVRRTFVAGHPAMAQHPHWRALRPRLVEGEALTVAEWRDVQMWSTLQWFGATAVRDYPELEALRRQGRDFSEADKQTLLDAQRGILAGIPSWLERLGRTGRVSLACSAYHHPILPLLVDTTHADRCMPSRPADPGFAYPEDALAQLTRGRSRASEVLGRAIEGLWPSEGSVSPEVIELAHQAGFRWFCADEGVLWRSERAGGRSLGPWSVGGLRGFFRNRELSDRIGFRYAEMDARHAVDDLVRGVKAAGGLQVIALDGENPWESFADAGSDFRQRLWDVLRGRDCPGVGMDEACRQASAGTIRRLHTGSWINTDFHIWIGEEEDVAGWRLLRQTRDQVAMASEPQRSEALEHVYAAEASDWFWWYGSHFSTPFADVFDELFRAHLVAAWNVLGVQPPDSLFEPVRRTHSRMPRSRRSLDWAEAHATALWLHSGTVTWPTGGSMSVGVAHVRQSLWQIDPKGNRWVYTAVPAELMHGHFEVQVAGECQGLDETAGGNGFEVRAVPGGFVLKISRQDEVPLALRVEQHGEQFRYGPVRLPAVSTDDVAWGL